ncbi:MAG TPA: DNA-deoxyinosine glycosylase [Xanthomonadaceae bacterium]|nr:DNA-deoxyinosine glycosylase [Xanthomonadaceae bacterium]
MNGVLDARLTSFAPAVDRHCRVLVLGSMPGARSLAEQRYYAHPHNAFWPILGAVCGFDPGLPYRRRVAALQRSGVGLWDVLRHCRRQGSLDARIRAGSEVANALPERIADLPALRAIAFNGGAAARLFRRHVMPVLPQADRERLQWLTLPSTSPAHAARTRAQKLAHWQALREHLR